MVIGICEDRPQESEWLAGVVRAWGIKGKKNIQIVQYQSAEQFWFEYEEGQLDAVFLDIMMPGEDGITLAKKLRKRGDMIPVVFVTGEKEYVLEGYEVEAVHYLLKPVSAVKVEECLDRITLKLESEEPVILLETANGLIRVRQKDILKIEVYGHDLVYTTVAGTYEIRSSLKECQKLLQEGWFVQCYRGILVNLWHVERIAHDQVILNGCQIPVSRRLYGEVNQAFISFYKKS